MKAASWGASAQLRECFPTRQLTPYPANYFALKGQTGVPPDVSPACALRAKLLQTFGRIHGCAWMRSNSEIYYIILYYIILYLLQYTMLDDNTISYYNILYYSFEIVRPMPVVRWVQAAAHRRQGLA